MRLDGEQYSEKGPINRSENDIGRAGKLDVESKMFIKVRLYILQTKM